MRGRNLRRHRVRASDQESEASRKIYDPRRWHKTPTTISNRRRGGEAPAGWVLVWAGRFKRWRRRWFVAHPAGLLLYYKNSDQIGRPGCINLLGACILPDGVKLRQLKIVRGPVVYYLRTTTKEFRQGWLDAISESVCIYNKSLKNVAVGVIPNTASDSYKDLREDCEEQEKEIDKRLLQHVQDIEPACQDFLHKLHGLQQSLVAISETLGFSGREATFLPADVAVPDHSLTSREEHRNGSHRSLFGRRVLKQKKTTLEDELRTVAPVPCKRSYSQPICSSTTLDAVEEALPLSRKRMSSDISLTVDQDAESSSCPGYVEEKRQCGKPVLQGSLHAAWNNLQEAYVEALKEEIGRVIELEAENLVLQESLAMLPQLRKDRLALKELREKLKRDGFYSEENNQEEDRVGLDVVDSDDEDDISIVATELTNEEYFEALEVINQHEFIAKSTTSEEQEICGDVGQEPPEEGDIEMLSEAEVEEPDQPRTRLPAPRPLSMGFSLWTVLKHAIGKDLNHITMPATINEPLSALQRCAEQMQFCYLLQSAAENTSSMQRLLLVCSFACASYNDTIVRDAKPFNPMLGETYEWQAYDGSARFVSEQVSHHPPVMAFQGDATNGAYSLYGELEIKNKFWGKSVEVLPVGTCHALFPKHEDHFTWNQVTTCIHNVVMGKPWIDSYGEMIVKNQRTQEYARIRFHKAISREQGRVSGKAYDCLGNAVFDLHGNYMDKLLASPESCSADECGTKCLWKSPQPPYDHRQQYCFSQFAIGLNELTSRLARALPPTDSRFRPDQRALEDGNLEKATPEKFRLEEKQRMARKHRKEKGIEWRSRWFQQTVPGKVQVQAGEEPNWKFNGKYWEDREKQAWDDCPDIM